jgi:hypothetical protein
VLATGTLEVTTSATGEKAILDWTEVVSIFVELEVAVPRLSPAWW